MPDPKPIELNWRSYVRIALPSALLAGTLDLLSAFAYTAADGKNALAVPIAIATAIWPTARLHLPPAMVVGILLHYLIMLLMVVFFIVTAEKLPIVRKHPIMSGVIYGLFLWLVMYCMVLPVRWPGLFPQLSAKPLIEQWFSHIVLVGIPISISVNRATERRSNLKDASYRSAS